MAYQSPGLGAKMGMPGVSEWIAPRRNAILGFASGLARGPDFGQGVAYGLEGAMQGRQADDAYATAQKAEAERMRQIEEAAALKSKYSAFFTEQGRPDIAQGIADGIVEPGAAYMDFIKPKDAKTNEFQTRYDAGQQYGLSGEDLNTFALTGSLPGTARQNVTYGTTPVWGRDTVTQKEGYGVTGSDGSFKLVDTGSFQPMGPGEVAADRAASTISAKGTTEAALALPNTIAQAEQSLSNLDGLLPQLDGYGKPIAGTNKGFDEQFGSIGIIPQQWLGTLDGTEKAGFQSRVGQVQGEAFLTAITQLKGLGALSDAEGQAATKAITRISTKLPQGEFIKAVKELQDIVRKGIERAKSKAALSPAADTLGVGGGPNQPSGVNYVFNPSTGRLEPQ